MLHLQRSRAFLTHINVTHVCGRMDNMFRTATKAKRKDDSYTNTYTEKSTEKNT